MKMKFVVLAAVLLAAQVFGDVIDISGPGSTIDATVNSYQSTTNYGSSTSFELRNYQVSARQWGVIKFDLPTLEAGEYISDAAMNFEYFANYNSTAGSMMVNLYQLNYDWVESQVTWTERMSGTSWENGNIGWAPPAVNYTDVVLGSITLVVNEFGVKTFQSAELTALLNNMAKGLVANYGFLLRPAQEAYGPNNRFYIATSERTDNFDIPMLSLTIVPEPITLIILSLGGMFCLGGRK